jgi:hypothetical protein
VAGLNIKYRGTDGWIVTYGFAKQVYICDWSSFSTGSCSIHRLVEQKF